MIIIQMFESSWSFEMIKHFKKCLKVVEDRNMVLFTKNFHTNSFMKSSRSPMRKLPIFPGTQEMLINVFKAAEQSLDVMPDGSDSRTSLSATGVQE